MVVGIADGVRAGIGKKKTAGNCGPAVQSFESRALQVVSYLLVQGFAFEPVDLFFQLLRRHPRYLKVSKN
jgi:hypothetical protein